MSKALQAKLRQVLQNTVGSVVELPESALSVALVSGRVSLGPSLQIKPDLFLQLGLPVILRAGVIESIEIEIPVAHLRTKPVRVRVKQVLITLSPNAAANPRRAKLAAHERLWEQAADEGEGVDGDSKMGRIVAKIFDNIQVRPLANHEPIIYLSVTLTPTHLTSSQVTVEDVHIRLEDSASQGEPFAMGLTLDWWALRSFVVEPGGGTWREACVKPVQRYLNKMLVCGRQEGARPGESGLGLYINTGQAPMPAPGSEAWRAAMLALLRPSAPVRWILKPSIIETRVSYDKLDLDEAVRSSRLFRGMAGAKRELRTRIRALQLRCTDKQLQNLYGLLVLGQQMTHGQLHAQSRPRCRPSAGADARAWWVFAIRGQLNEMGATLRTQAFSQMVRDGGDYVQLWERKAGIGRSWLAPLDPADVRRCKHIEDIYPADVTKTWRIRAWRLLLSGDKERQGRIQTENDVRSALLA